MVSVIIAIVIYLFVGSLWGYMTYTFNTLISPDISKFKLWSITILNVISWPIQMFSECFTGRYSINENNISKIVDNIHNGKYKKDTDEDYNWRFSDKVLNSKLFKRNRKK